MADAARGAEEPKAELSSAEEMLELIVIKEDEIKARIQRAEDDAQRQIEEAKLDAATRKREAAAVEVGDDIREKTLADARAEAGKITAEVTAQADELRKRGMERVDDAVKMVIEGVLPPS